MTTNYGAASHAVDGLPIEGSAETTQMIAVAQVFATLAIADAIKESTRGIDR